MLNGADLKMLNVGCGDVSHSSWVNLDINGDGSVYSYDVTKGIPFADETFDVVYHSHLLEHLLQSQATDFMKECYRVMKPGGIIRVLVPNLEQITRLYLEKLSTANEFEADYDWIMLEMYDQCVRRESGGNMEHYLRNSYKNLTQFVVSRIGSVIVQYGEQSKVNPTFSKPTLKSFMRVMSTLRMELAKLLTYVMAGKKGREAFEEGLFRNSGEIHRWMYDSFSLGKLMAKAGFVEISNVSPFESRIRDFSRYELDVSDGIVRKPDSLVMEGVRP